MAESGSAIRLWSYCGTLGYVGCMLELVHSDDYYISRRFLKRDTSSQAADLDVSWLHPASRAALIIICKQIMQRQQPVQTILIE